MTIFWFLYFGDYVKRHLSRTVPKAFDSYQFAAYPCCVCTLAKFKCQAAISKAKKKLIRKRKLSFVTWCSILSELKKLTKINVTNSAHNNSKIVRIYSNHSIERSSGSALVVLLNDFFLISMRLCINIHHKHRRYLRFRMENFWVASVF